MKTMIAALLSALAFSTICAAKTDKTLVSWVTPANTTQRGGSVITIQSGDMFDGIVFGELQTGKWMAGSNFHRRTEKSRDDYPTETADNETQVQLAAVYDGGAIRLYRNGVLYASHQAENIDLLSPKNNIAVFGLRHVGAGGGYFAGTIDDARIYDLKNWTHLGLVLHGDMPDIGVDRNEDISCANMFPIGDQWMLLRIKPLRELEKLRHDEQATGPITVKSNSTRLLEGISGDAIELRVTIKPTNANEFGVRVFCNEEGNGFPITIVPRDQVLSLGNIKPPFALREGEDLDLRIFLDKGMVEVFVNDRQAAVYMHPHATEDVGVRLFSHGRSMEATVQAWSMKSIDDDEFRPVFDGKTLNGWSCRPIDQAGDWSVSEGRIIGRGTGRESYLVFKDELGDFDLKFRYRMRTKGNTGLQVRGKPVPGKASRLHGYHADIGHVGIGDKVLGAWDFHENNRGSYLAKRGERVTIAGNGTKTVVKIDGALKPEDVRKGGWNEVSVHARGNRLWFTVNGKMASEVIDNESAKRIDKGLIGFQLHKGDRMVVEFKDIRLRIPNANQMNQP